MGNWASALADLAPTLKEAELRVILELARRQLTSPGGVRASGRDIARACKTGRRNIQYALDSLTTRGLITARQGTATTAATYRVNAFDTVLLGGVATTPPPPQQGVLGGVFTTPPLASLRRHPGDVTTPPPPESTRLTAAAASVEISTASLAILDRVFSATGAKTDPEDLRTFRAWLHGYMSKLGRDDNNQPLRNPHPPDDKLVAQFLAADEPKALGTMLDALMLERQTCQSYFWFVTVALQRRHGIGWQETKRARQALRIVKAGNKPDTHAPDYAQQLALDLARRKAMP